MFSPVVWAVYGQNKIKYVLIFMMYCFRFSRIWSPYLMKRRIVCQKVFQYLYFLIRRIVVNLNPVKHASNQKDKNVISLFSEAIDLSLQIWYFSPDLLFLIYICYLALVMRPRVKCRRRGILVSKTHTEKRFDCAPINWNIKNHMPRSDCMRDGDLQGIPGIVSVWTARLWSIAVCRMFHAEKAVLISLDHVGLIYHMGT